ncbi:MAG: SLC13 family permease, partial [Candidatus Promineifilaceae bacterium]|nr:SLC13 family permease [Candidatus Promineifilaceae bacterium]
AGNALALRMVTPVKGQTVELDLTEGSAELAEVTLSPRSELIGRSLRNISFRARYDLSVLAMRHHGQSILTNMHDVPLEFGDSLLIQGEKKQIELLYDDDDFLVLDTPPIETRRLSKAPLALGILIGVLLVIAFGWLNPAIAMLSGALLLVITGVLTMQEAYQSIDWKSVFLIAGILPLGLAMETTGTAQLIADLIVDFMGDYGALGVLVGFFVMTSLLTAVISNAAATVLVVPIAIESALSLQASPYAFVMAVVIAASTSFILPIGHQANIIVYGPGGYRFFDYTKVGVGLSLLLLLVVAFILPLIWPLFPA